MRCFSRGQERSRKKLRKLPVGWIGWLELNLESEVLLGVITRASSVSMETASTPELWNIQMKSSAAYARPLTISKTPRRWHFPETGGKG